ncbi:RNA methyltransferase KNAG_0J01740 [Huiozyma naganishii CBS 8797]|uniref:Trimethylguanosine synthase n=1 Tax=Huiozyma naganishii (strain ATCC MYA-139 / BCRC 22969 / CBS 8797 / KCTC 17520 / NBRC 10181 / NCYC 3082 / Yp74L-3) TaxID=1071383 RepID=J7RBJ7_HUIN7|nr:hypothetical protein KNAG_0J01740 [Kazachstania naganishii CBS 8797]CCK72255.1 hypothetical protein KNAG_0J01740 [Kazachstania naganishii CBS 8797]
MGKKVIHAAHFERSLKKRSPKRFQRLKPDLENETFKVISNRKLKNPKLFKYWKNRVRIFSKIHENNIHLTEALWFSVTPESISKFVAQFAKSCLPDARCILDVCCGGGGNTIQFAQLFPRVIGVDNDLSHLYCCVMNCRAYNVEKSVWLKYGPWNSDISLGKDVTVDCIFSSPPWGGPEYLHADKYDLEKSLQPGGITYLLRSFAKFTQNIILFLPRNSNLQQIASSTRSVFGPLAKCKVLYVKDNGYLKGIMCMWGAPFLNYNTASSDEEPSDEPKSVTQPAGNTSELYDING